MDISTDSANTPALVNDEKLPVPQSSSSSSDENLQNISTTTTTTTTTKPSDIRPATKGSEELCEFLENLDNYSSTVPEAVVKYHLQKGGFNVHDQKVLKLVGLAADKFLADIVHEAKEISKLRNSTGKRKSKETVLEMVCIY